MRLEEVPQDAAILEQCHEIAYAVDENGTYVLVPSAGWESVNLVNMQAWEVVGAQIKHALEQINNAAASPLLYHMECNQMDVGLLASYVGLTRWRVKRHLKPKGYAALKPELRARYAAVFQIPVEHLDKVPARVELPLASTSKEEDL
ncbi:MAG: hypothetical protein RBR06_06275 [Desulfuromonadaceae bacterium]|nr:hypothetical protein [Desulfuromonadaceae bacterium]